MADPGKTRSKELQSAIESIQRGEFQKAENILLEITAREPTNFDANHMLGIVSTELNKFEQAEKFFKASLSINTTSPVLYKNYGFFLTRAKQFDKAIEQFDVALPMFDAVELCRRCCSPVSIDDIFTAGLYSPTREP